MSRSTIMFAAAALSGCLAVSLTSCQSAPQVKPEVPATIAVAVADSARTANDIARDANRKPTQVLAFAAIKPGAIIAELIPGDGYYTRLLSAAAGPGGHVYALVPPPGLDGKDRSAPVKAIAADARYGNVTVLPLSYTDRALDLPRLVDVVWTSDNYHDMHNMLDSAQMTDFAQHMVQALRPGGMFLVLDHAAAPGRGVSDTHTLHRIDEETVKAEVTAAGFRLVDSNGVLRNPDDPHTAKVFDPSVRGRTDQFILKFVK